MQATAIVEAVEMRGPFAPNELAEFLDGLEGHPDDALDDEWRSRLTTQKYVTLVWTDSLRKIPDLDISDLRRGRQDSWQVLPDSHVETVYSRLKSGWVDVVTND